MKTIKTERYKIASKEASLNVWDLGTTDYPIADQILKNKEYYEKNKGLTAKEEWMSPDEYISRISKMFKSSIEDTLKVVENERVNRYAELMKEGVKFPKLVIEEHLGMQEGRHRALAAKKLGINKVPVVIIERM